MAVWDIKMEMRMNDECFKVFFPVLLKLKGALFNLRCAGASPSIQYSIFRKTISMNKVCGHIHPHQILPKTTVKSVMNTKKRIIKIASSTKSCGQNACPRMINFRSKIFNRRKGRPPIVNQGPLKNRDMSTTATTARHRCKFPPGFFGNSHIRLPSLSTVPIVSRNSSSYWYRLSFDWGVSMLLLLHRYL